MLTTVQSTESKIPRERKLDCTGLSTFVAIPKISAEFDDAHLPTKMSVNTVPYSLFASRILLLQSMGPVWSSLELFLIYQEKTVHGIGH